MLFRSAEKQKHLFSGMLESEAPTDSSRSSMGIGLSVCRTIVKAHGSDIHVQNRPGGGAVFRFSLDMEESSHVK